MLFNAFQDAAPKASMPLASIRPRGLPPSTHTCTCLLASTQARMRAAVHALATKQNSASQGAAQHRPGKGARTLRALIEDVKSPESSQRRGDRSQQLFPNSFVNDIRLLGFRFSLLGHTRCGRHFRGREAAALDPPTDRYGRKVAEGEGAP